MLFKSKLLSLAATTLCVAVPMTHLERIRSNYQRL